MLGSVLAHSVAQSISFWHISFHWYERTYDILKKVCHPHRISSIHASVITETSIGRRFPIFGHNFVQLISVVLVGSKFKNSDLTAQRTGGAG